MIVGIECSYEDVWKIIDARRDNQLHRSLHANAYYLNPHFHYICKYKKGYIRPWKYWLRMLQKEKNNNLRLVDFHYARGLFTMNDARECRKALLPKEWWEMFRMEF